jgi:hypothetical protein
MQQVQLQEDYLEQEPSHVIPVQTIQPAHFDALMRMLRPLGATATEAERLALHHILGDSNSAASQHQLEVTAEALRRISVVYPDLPAEMNDSIAPRQAAPTPTQNGAPTVTLYIPRKSHVTRSDFHAGFQFRHGRCRAF